MLYAAVFGFRRRTLRYRILLRREYREVVCMKLSEIKRGFICLILFFAVYGWMWSGCVYVQAEEAPDLAGAKKAVIQTYQNYQTQVDLTAFHLYNSRDDEAINQMMTEVVNQTPGLFYTGMQFSKYVVVGSDQIKGLKLEYARSFCRSDGSVDVSKIQKTQAKISKQVKKALKCVKSGMSTLEKALVLHDYLISHIQYLEDESKEYRYSEWGAFVKGKANCQGYSLAYGILMQEVGIPVDYVVSEEMLHMWNQIKIGGKWYHVDVTWDDPLDTRLKKDQYGLVLHDRFLCSTKKMKKKGYHGFQGRSAKSRKYDKKFWANINSEIFYRNGKWIYQTDSRIEQRNSLVKGKAKPLYWAGGNYFIALDKNRYYFINYNRIYLYKRKTQKMYLVLDGTKRHRGSDMISQLKYDSGKLTYRVVKGERVRTVTRKVRKNGLLAKS